VNLPYEPEILKSVALPAIFIEKINNSLLWTFVYWAIAVLLAYLLIRFIFTLHELIIENKSITQALIKSFQLTRRISFRLIIALVFINAVIMAIGFILFTVISYIPTLFNFKINAFIKTIAVTTSSLLTLIYTLLIMPINIIFLTKLYHQAKAQEKTYINRAIHTVNFKVLETIESTFDQFFTERKIAIIFVMIIVIVISSFTGFLVNQSTMHAGRNVLSIAHRGKVKNEFENSLNAIQASVDAEVDGIEIDIQMTKDGVVVLHHDRNLLRTFGVDQAIESLTYQEIQRIEAENVDVVHDYGKIIPTLAQALKLMPEEMTIILDVKTDDGNQQLAESINAVIKTTDMSDDTVVQSFNRDFLKRIKRINSEIKVSQIMYYALGNLSTLEVDYYTIHKGMLSVAFVKKARGLDRGIFVWAVNNEEDMREVLNYDVDGIITNQPLLFKDILGRAFDED
jgi:glycerophosphoryl diester phosphodiesterase